MVSIAVISLSIFYISSSLLQSFKIHLHVLLSTVITASMLELWAMDYRDDRLSEREGYFGLYAVWGLKHATALKKSQGSFNCVIKKQNPFSRENYQPVYLNLPRFGLSESPTLIQVHEPNPSAIQHLIYLAMLYNHCLQAQINSGRDVYVQSTLLWGHYRSTWYGCYYALFQLFTKTRGPKSKLTVKSSRYKKPFNNKH